MNADLKKIATGVGGLAKARESEVAVEQARERNKERRSSALKTIGVVASIVFGAVGMLAVILNFISKMPV